MFGAQPRQRSTFARATRSAAAGGSRLAIHFSYEKDCVVAHMRRVGNGQIFKEGKAFVFRPADDYVPNAPLKV